MKNKMLIQIFSIMLLFMFLFSCATDVTSDSSSEEQTKILADQKQQASRIFQTAQEEFFSGVPSMENSNRSIGDVSMENLGVKEQIIAAAWEAYYSGDMEKVNALLKENGLYDKAQALIAKYDLKKQQEILNQKSGIMQESDSRSVSSSFFYNFLDGDIFLCYGGSSSSAGSILGLFIPGHWKHAGIMDKATAPSSTWCILSASNTTNIPNGAAVGRVGYEANSKWAGEGAVIALRVHGRTDANSRDAVNYGRTFLGQPFSFFTSREANTEFYCSKLVWRSWLSQGRDLETKTWFDIWVTPQDLYDDADTYYIGGDRN